MLTLQTLFEKMKEVNPGQMGTYYDLTTDNRLGLIMGTPLGIWGKRLKNDDFDENPPAHHSDIFAHEIYNILSQAEHLIDILSVAEPDGLFKKVIATAIKTLAQKDVLVRIGIGQHVYPGKYLNTAAYLREITEAILGTKEPQNIRVCVAAINTADSSFLEFHQASWIHAKVVAVDGKFAIVGGHNLLENHYLKEKPISDLSIRLDGDAALSAHKFADGIWAYVQRYNVHDGKSLTYCNTYQTNMITKESAPAYVVRSHTWQHWDVGNLSVLAVAVPGYGVPDSNDQPPPSEQAVRSFIKSAQKEVCLSQQDLLGLLGPLSTEFLANETDPELMKALAEFLIRSVGIIKVVLSNPGAHSLDNTYYSNSLISDKAAKISLRMHDLIINTLSKALRTVYKDLTKNDLDKEKLYRMLARVRIGYIRFNGLQTTWPDGSPFGNHAKFWMIDRRVFYVGSDNLYPEEIIDRMVYSRLTEYGYIIESHKEAERIRRKYWNFLAYYSLPDREARAEFSSFTSSGSPIVHTKTDWRNTWKCIIPGKFTPASAQDSCLFFYDQVQGEGEFYEIDNQAQLKKIGSTKSGLGQSLHSIIPGKFSDSTFTDLLFYDDQEGQLEFYRTDKAEQLTKIGPTYKPARKTWHSIIPGKFSAGGTFTDLMFYDDYAGNFEFYKTNDKGELEKIGGQPTRRTWHCIIPGKFSQSEFTDLLFYDAAAGQFQFYQTDGKGNLTPIGPMVTGRQTWQSIIPGKFSQSDSPMTDLLFWLSRF